MGTQEPNYGDLRPPSAPSYGAPAGNPQTFAPSQLQQQQQQQAYPPPYKQPYSRSTSQRSDSRGDAYSSRDGGAGSQERLGNPAGLNPLPPSSALDTGYAAGNDRARVSDQLLRPSTAPYGAAEVDKSHSFQDDLPRLQPQGAAPPQLQPQPQYAQPPPPLAPAAGPPGAAAMPHMPSFAPQPPAQQQPNASTFMQQPAPTSGAAQPSFAPYPSAPPAGTQSPPQLNSPVSAPVHSPQSSQSPLPAPPFAPPTQSPPQAQQQSMSQPAYPAPAPTPQQSSFGQQPQLPQQTLQQQSSPQQQLPMQQPSPQGMQQQYAPPPPQAMQYNDQRNNSPLSQQAYQQDPGSALSTNDPRQQQQLPPQYPPPQQAPASPPQHMQQAPQPQQLQQAQYQQQLPQQPQYAQPPPQLQQQQQQAYPQEPPQHANQQQQLQGQQYPQPPPQSAPLQQQQQQQLQQPQPHLSQQQPRSSHEYDNGGDRGGRRDDRGGRRRPGPPTASSGYDDDGYTSYYSDEGTRTAEQYSRTDDQYSDDFYSDDESRSGRTGSGSASVATFTGQGSGYGSYLSEQPSRQGRHSQGGRPDRGGGKRDHSRMQPPPQEEDEDEEEEDRFSNEPPPPAAAYRGDLSEWGRKRVDLDKPPSEGSWTLSSGLSPRDDVSRSFDVGAAKRTLAYNAGRYGAAAHARRDGTAPAALGIAEDLPDRMAYEQLTSLAGMASKVMRGIEHSKAVFEARVRLQNQTLERKAFDAWRAARFGSIAKQQLLAKCIKRLMHRKLARAFAAWHDKYHLVDRSHAMRLKVAATITKGRLRRTFTEWKRLAHERWWKNQYVMRENQVHALEKRIAGYQMRPLFVLRGRRLRGIMHAWHDMAQERHEKNQRLRKVFKHWADRKYLKAWNSWMMLVAENKRVRDILKKAAGRMRNIKLAAAFSAWLDLLAAKQDKEDKLAKALGHFRNNALTRTWHSWSDYVAYHRDKKRKMMHWMMPAKARFFYYWQEYVVWRAKCKLIMERATRRLLNRRLAMAFDAWHLALHNRKFNESTGSREDLEKAYRDMREENERLRRDNERFVRLIDSGEWGRGRVAELVGAGEVLKGERDALLQLIQSLRREYEAVQRAKVNQEDELRALKDRMVVGGAARNKMLVKGGSSFNALVRAMKQDLVEGGRPSGPGLSTGPVAGPGGRDPNILYEVDKLSMDQIVVFPDGEVSVKAVASSPSSAAFARGISAGQSARPTTGGPVQPLRVPGIFPGGGGAVSSPTHHRQQPYTAQSYGPIHPTGAARRSTSGLRPSGTSAAGGGARQSTEAVVAYLQSLSPEELDAYENAFRAERAGGGGADPNRPPGMVSTAPPRR